MAVLTPISLTTYNSGTTAGTMTLMTSDSTQVFDLNSDELDDVYIACICNTTVATLTLSSGAYSDSRGSVELNLAPFDGAATLSTAGTTGAGSLQLFGPFESARFVGSTGNLRATFNTTTATTVIGGRIAFIQRDKHFWTT